MDTALSVLQVLPALDTGGVERGTLDIADAILAVGGRALVASNGGKLVRPLVRAGAEHFQLPVHKRDPLSIYRNIRPLSKIIRDHDIELVHARSRGPAWSAYYAAKACHKPFVTTFHGAYSLNGVPFKKRYNAIMTQGDLVIAVSNDIAQHIESEYGIDPGRIRVVHRGVDTQALDPEIIDPRRQMYLYEQWKLPGDKRFVTLPGRITRWKGQHLLIEAMRHVQTRDACALIVGPGAGHEDYVMELHKMIRTHKLHDRVVLVDVCDDMPSLYGLSDVVVSASIRPEPFGRITAEAMSMGRQTIAPNYGGAAEQILHAETGWLFQPGDVKGLAYSIDMALNLDPDTKQRMAQAARTRAINHFSKESMAQATLNVYAELL